ncbi:hypothetical protein ES676_11780 [Bizionia saleffrena]|uniref:CAP-Gly protein n=1 Tax=Bizionia saleffrena TaxID=291189 RepID=A0A8H2QKQ0_9FLAO|nr:hypothetical protein [Bizionia saleffrena]TYB71822.1 hypothetical protein ES676_11780 [Bizionia saleffrena]
MNMISTPLNSTKNRFSRISWGGVFAGALAAIVISFVLHLLGLGIGMTSIDPMTDSEPFNGIGTGAIIWWILSNLSALFVGGLIAARSAGLPSNADGGIHGFLAWGVYLVISVFLVISFVSNTFSGMGSLISSAFNSDNAKEVMVNLDTARKSSNEDTYKTFDRVKQEMFQLIDTAEKYNIVPNDSKENVKDDLQTLNNKSSQALKKLNLKDAITEFVNDIEVNLDNNGDLDISVQGNKDYLNEADLKDYLTNNTDLTEKEINGVISKWKTKLDTAVKNLEETYATAKKEALEASEKVSDAAGETSIYLFVLLLLGAFAAFFGGATGAPPLNVNEERTREIIK